MERKLVAILAVLGGAALFAGCLNGYPEQPGDRGEARVRREAPPPDREWDEWDDEDWEEDWENEFPEGNLTVSNGHLSGDMGDVRAFAGAATSQWGEGGAGWAEIYVTTTNPSEGYSVMTIIGLLNGWSAEPTMHVTGCSGPREGSWDFDAPANVVTVEVGEGSIPGNLRFDFEATFSGGQVTRGSFGVAVP